MQELFDSFFDSLPVNPGFASTVEVCPNQFEFQTTEFKRARNEITHAGSTVGFLFAFDGDALDSILSTIGKKTLIRELGKKPEKIFGLKVLPDTFFPIHLDMNPNRVTMVYNMMLSGVDSKTTLYDKGEKIFELRGIHNYHFNPNLVAHSAEAKADPIRLLQFFY